MKYVRYGLLFLLACYLLTGIYQIRPEEQAVVRRFGKVVAKPGPGLWIGLPWGIDRVDRVPIATVRRLVVGYQPDAEDNPALPVGQLLTGDQNLINVQLNIDYVLSDESTALEDFVMNRDRIDGVIVREAETALIEWASGRTVDEVLLIGNTEIPSWVLQRTQERIQPQRLGVRLQQASVAYLAPLDEVRNAFDEVNRAQTNILTQEFRARQDADQREREALAEAYRLDQQGKAYSEGKRRLAQAEADAFRQRTEKYHELRAKNPNILTAMWWDAMSQTLLAMKSRGRVDVLDAYLGPDGLDIMQIVSPQPRKK
jgi:membrane protease subunit HflK